MKWTIFIFLIGVIEVWATGQLHYLLGTGKLITIYVITTAIGAAFLYVQLPVFLESFKAIKSIGKKWKKKAKDPGYKPTAEDMEKLRPAIFAAIYASAAILIAIPGIVSDVLGIILLLSVVSNRLIEYQLKKAIENAK